MTDREKIKKMFNNQINKATVYNNVLEKVEGVNDMKSKVLKFSLAPICLVLVICGVMLFNPQNNSNNNDDISDYIQLESMAHEIYINKLKDFSQADIDVQLDADVKVQEEFVKYSFIDNMIIPSDLSLSSKHLVYTRKDNQTTQYDILHDYVLWYEKMENNINTKKIIVAFSKDFEPLRDYFIDINNLKVSKINNTELIIVNYNDMCIATFTHNDLNFDIETKGITQEELIQLLESIILYRNSANEPEEVVNNEDIALIDGKQLNVPSYFGGIYTENGRTVIYLLEDTKANRTEIANYFSIDESTIIFRKPNHSYQYLTELQNKISEKMADRTFNFIVASALLDDKNIIEVTVLKSTKDRQIAEIKKLDTTGTAIKVVYGDPVAREDIILE